MSVTWFQVSQIRIVTVPLDFDQTLCLKFQITLTITGIIQIANTYTSNIQLCDFAEEDLGNTYKMTWSRWPALQVELGP